MCDSVHCIHETVLIRVKSHWILIPKKTMLDSLKPEGGTAQTKTGFFNQKFDLSSLSKPVLGAKV